MRCTRSSSWSRDASHSCLSVSNGSSCGSNVIPVPFGSPTVPVYPSLLPLPLPSRRASRLSCCYKLEVFGGRRFHRHQLANAYIRSCVSRGSIAHIHPAALQGAWSRSHAVGSVAALLVP